MKIFQTTALAASLLFVLGAAQEVNSASIQPLGQATAQDNFILAHGGHGGHGHGGHHGGHWGHHGGHWGHGWHGHHGWRHGHRGWGGGWWGGVYYGPNCYWNSFGQYVCYRPYNYYY